MPLDANRRQKLELIRDALKLATVTEGKNDLDVLGWGIDYFYEIFRREDFLHKFIERKDGSDMADEKDEKEPENPVGVAEPEEPEEETKTPVPPPPARARETEYPFSHTCKPLTNLSLQVSLVR